MNICVVGCPPGEQLFQFPSRETDNERRKKWLEYFDIEDQRILYACKRHFSNEQRCGSKLKLNGVPDIPLFRNTTGPFQRKLNSWSSNVIVVTPKDPEFVIYKNQTGIFSQDQFQNENYITNTIQIPILQPKPIIPTIKSISCSMSAQTNTRLCGSVEISEFLNEYRLNCFYCCDTFPIEKYSKFINHLKDIHFEEEQAFKIKKYPLGDHDYTTIRSRSPERINASSSQPRNKFIDAKDRPFNIGMAETLMKLLNETLLNPNFRNTEEDNILVIKSNNNKKLRATNVLEQIINKESNASPEVEKITYNKESIPSVSVNRNLKNDITLKSKNLPIKHCIESISDTESEFETNTEFISSSVSPPQANIPESSILSISSKNINSEKLSKPYIPLSPTKKIIIKEKDATVEKRVVQQTLKNINDFETVYKAVKKRTARAMSSGIFYIKDIKNNKMIEKQTSKQTPLNRCLKRANTETTESLPEATKILIPSHTELVFQFTPRAIILDLLDTIKDYPILWEFHKEPNNDDYAKTISELCEKLNKKWSLNISPLKMRRSINRIFTEYCYTLNCKKVVKFEEYFKKLAEFLPGSENDIPLKRCQYCDICYAKESEMKKHLVEKHQYSNWQYICNACTERFMEIDEYELHKHLPHYLEIFKCQQCNKAYSTIFPLERHKRKFHNSKVIPKPLKLYKCSMCDKRFENRCELTCHNKYHMETRFKCHLCPKVYNQKTTLTFHLKKHKHQLDFVCEFCGKAFLKSSHLNSHLEKHTGEKVTCNICHIKLRKCSLSRHLRLCHVACEGTIESTFRAQSYRYTRFLNNNSTKSFRVKRPYKRTKEEGPRIYDCKKCNIPFDRLKFLKDHNNVVHSDVEVMPCKICKIKFRHTHNIKIHYRQKHNLSLFQVYKLHDQNMDLDTVLNMKIEDMPETVVVAKNPILKQDQSSLYCTNDEQDGYDGTIMKAVESIDKQEIKVDNNQSMNEFTDLFVFTDLFKHK